MPGAFPGVYAEKTFDIHTLILESGGCFEETIPCHAASSSPLGAEGRSLSPTPANYIMEVLIC